MLYSFSSSWIHRQGFIIYSDLVTFFVLIIFSLFFFNSRGFIVQILDLLVLIWKMTLSLILLLMRMNRSLLMLIVIRNRRRRAFERVITFSFGRLLLRLISSKGSLNFHLMLGTRWCTRSRSYDILRQHLIFWICLSFVELKFRVKVFRSFLKVSMSLFNIDLIREHSNIIASSVRILLVYLFIKLLYIVIRVLKPVIL